jgi:TRAP-type uncharacterized transport system fused permease subunit
MQVHFEAKRYGLRGLTEDEMPRLAESLKMRWPTLIPLALLISILVSGRTPYLAAFVGISSCAIVGLSTKVSGNQLKNWGLMVVMHVILMTIAFSDFGNHNSTIKLGLFALAVAVGAAAYILAGVRGRIEAHVLVEALETGAKYALAVGAAAATDGCWLQNQLHHHPSSANHLCFHGRFYSN